MGSRIMHAIIANGIAENYVFKIKLLSYSGGVAPDAVHSAEEKGTSHFYAGTTKNYTRRIAFNSFFKNIKLKWIPLFS